MRRDADEEGLTTGALLDQRYRLERPLGAGGMSKVWAAEHVGLGRKVAIKTLRSERGDHDARLAREARLLASLHHPAIVQIFDVARTAGGTRYLVMELVRGPTLEAALDRLHRLTAEEAVSVLLPVIDGLAAAHAAGIIHRDVKPGNVVLARNEDGSITPKLLDFGIARASGTSDAARLESITIDGDVIGTPAYMSPEQLDGRLADARSDVWAVGATLYDLIVGEPPFVGATLFELMRKAREDPPPYPRDAEGLDGALWAILVDALRKRPEERPPSATSLATRLRTWLDARGGPRPLTRLYLAPSSSDSPSSSRGAETEAPPDRLDEARRADIDLDALIRARLGDE